MEVEKIEQLNSLNREGLIKYAIKGIRNQEFKTNLVDALHDIVEEMKQIRAELIQIGEKI